MSCWVHLCCLLLAISSARQAIASTSFKENSLFFEDFGNDWESRWVQSTDNKYTGRFQQYTPAGWFDDETAIQAPDKNKHYGIVSQLAEPVDPSKGLVVQYEVKYPDGVTCGGAYLKLSTFNAEFDPAKLDDKTPYSIMFGPDKCGSGKVHLILRHVNPLNGSIEEKHLKDPPLPVTDKLTHVYTLVLEANNRYTVLIDGEEKSSGSLMDSFAPAFNPPKEIPDPEDVKPADWVDEPKMTDPDATKPDDWVEEEKVVDTSAKKPSGWLDNEPSMVDDRKAKKPAEWNDDEDGDWSPPQVPNPKCKVGCGNWEPPMKANPDYKGPWKAPLIDNPAYKGPWVQKTIPNPDFYEDNEPMANIGKIGAVAIEIWTVDSGYTFDNILITADKATAKAARQKLWKPKHDKEEKVEEEKAAEEEAIAAKQRGEKLGVAKIFHELANTGFLSFMKPQLDSVTEMVETYPAVGYALFVLPILLLFTTMFCCRGRRVVDDDDVGQRKKTDEPELDDEEEEEEGEAEEEKEEGTDAAAGTSAAADPAEPIEEEEEDEKPEGKSTRVRRRKA